MKRSFSFALASLLASSMVLVGPVSAQPAGQPQYRIAHKVISAENFGGRFESFFQDRTEDAVPSMARKLANAQANLSRMAGRPYAVVTYRDDSLIDDNTRYQGGEYDRASPNATTRGNLYMPTNTVTVAVGRVVGLDTKEVRIPIPLPDAAIQINLEKRKLKVVESVDLTSKVNNTGEVNGLDGNGSSITKEASETVYTAMDGQYYISGNSNTQAILTFIGEIANGRYRKEYDIDVLRFKLERQAEDAVVKEAAAFLHHQMMDMIEAERPVPPRGRQRFGGGQGRQGQGTISLAPVRRSVNGVGLIPDRTNSSDRSKFTPSYDRKTVVIIGSDPVLQSIREKLAKRQLIQTVIYVISPDGAPNSSATVSGNLFFARNGASKGSLQFNPAKPLPEGYRVDEAATLNAWGR